VTNRVAVVGGGVIGAAVAYELTCAGAAVTLFERRTVASGASGAAPGLVGPLVEAMSDRPTSALAARAISTTEALVQRVEADSGLDAGFRRTGSFHLAGDSREAGMFRSWPGRTPDEMPVAWADAAAARDEEPHVIAGEFGGVYCAAESQVMPAEYARALIRAGSLRGLDVREGVDVQGVMFDGGRAAGVRTANGEFGADHVILCAGAWSGGFTLPAGLRLAIQPLRGARLALDPGRAVVRHIIYAPACDLSPKANGEVWVGATEEDAGFIDHVTARDVGELTAAALTTAPALGDARMAGAAAGLRPTTPDFVPILGPVCDGLTVATGHWRKGVQLAAITALVIRQSVLGETTDIDLTPFSASRFL
jgi:glycine oxidase